MTDKREMLADRVLIEPINESVTAGGVYIPDSVKDKPKEGKVILVGPGTKDVTMTVKPGDNAIFGEYSGIPYKEGGIDYLIMRQDDIFMINNKK